MNALVGSSYNKLREVKVITPDADSIDYHFRLSEAASINDTVIMSFRYQMFVTRSDVCIIEGIKSGNIKIVGMFNCLGDEKGE